MLRDLLKRNVNIWNEWGFETWYKSEQYSKEGRPKFSGLGAKVDEEEKEDYDREMNYYLKKVLEDDEFSETYGCLRRVYGKQWVEWHKPNSFVTVDKRTVEYDGGTKYPLFDIVEPCYTDEYVGKVYTTNNYGDFRVISKVGKDKACRHLYNIQFLKTGYIKTKVRRDVILNGNIKDLYYPSIAGVGYVGEYVIADRKGIDGILYKTWSHMIDRCYNTKCREYSNYGAKGIFVSKRWHNFSNFIEDVKQMRGFYLKMYKPHEYQLDKDYYGSNCYSMDTCVWIHKELNVKYKDNINPIIVTDNLDGSTEICMSISEACNILGTSENLRRYVDTPKRFIGRYSIKTLRNKDKLVRRPLEINQLQEVIYRIKTNPNDRRLIVSAWNPADIPNMALPPCHSFFQFYVNDGKLSCQLYQRSADTFLGVPFNIASYALLTHMVAHVCDLEVGEFIHTFGDLHLYANQIEMAKEMITREIRPMPKLIIKRKVDNIDDFTIDDFEIVGYNPHPPIKVEVAV